MTPLMARLDLSGANELPPGLRTRFEVIASEGRTGSATWLLRDTATDLRYFVRPSTINNWPLEPMPERRLSPCIIVAMVGDVMAALELATGVIYFDAPPTTLKQARTRTYALQSLARTYGVH
jgi:hypothetical protein